MMIKDEMVPLAYSTKFTETLQIKTVKSCLNKARCPAKEEITR